MAKKQKPDGVDVVEPAARAEKVRCTLAFKGLPLYGQSTHKLYDGNFVILQLGRIETFPEEVFQELKAKEPHLVALK